MRYLYVHSMPFQAIRIKLWNSGFKNFAQAGSDGWAIFSQRLRILGAWRGESRPGAKKPSHDK